MFICMLSITNTEGQQAYLVSGSGEWQVGNGSTLFNNIYLGTRIDNRLEVCVPLLRIARVRECLSLRLASCARMLCPFSVWLQPSGWSEPGYVPASPWPAPVPVPPPAGALVWRSIPPVRTQAQVPAAGPFHPGDGSIVYDVGVNQVRIVPSCVCVVPDWRSGWLCRCESVCVECVMWA